MAAFLSDEWFALVRDVGSSLPPRTGVDASLQCVVAGAPAGKVQFVVRVVDGRVTGDVFGPHIRVGGDHLVDAGVEGRRVHCLEAHGLGDRLGIAAVLDELRQHRLRLRGRQCTVDREVSYMRGDLKIDGNYVVYLLRLQPLFESAEFAAAGQSLRERTQF